MDRLKRVILMVFLVAGIIHIVRVAPRAYLLTFVESKIVDHAGSLDVREGDFIFQHLPGPLTEMIADVTNSPYSHCGIIARKGKGFVVLEAIGPVRETALSEWIARGVMKKITIVRLDAPYQKDIPRIIAAAYEFLDRPYDILYDWDDQKIYCSELIYKAVLNATGTRLAGFVRLGDLKWRPYEAAIRQLTGGDLPLTRQMITPEALAVSDKVHTVYSSFAARAVPGLQFRLADLRGTWKGRYTLVGTKVPLSVQIDGNGVIQRGWMGSGLGLEPVRLRAFGEETGEFSLSLVSGNRVKIAVRGRLDKGKRVVFGQWKDSLGYQGVFVLYK